MKIMEIYDNDEDGDDDGGDGDDDGNRKNDCNT